MLEEILFDNRHKFVYFEENKKDDFIECCLDNVNYLGGAIPVYIKDNGLPKNDSLLELDKYRIIIFHERYYSFLIGLCVIDTLCKKRDKIIIDKKLFRIYERLSDNCKMKINSIDDLRYVLEHDKNLYYEGYKKYLETGNLDFIEDLLMGYLMLEIFLKNIKRTLDIKRSFSVIYDYDDLSIDSVRVINKYINSRCNGYLSINILCGDKDWKSFYDNDGYIIQNIHDYIEVDYRNVKKKSRHN